MSTHRRNSPMQKSRWTTAIATAALLALPVAGFAQQTQPPSQPPQQPPPTTQQPPTQPPTEQPPAAQPPAAGQVDAAAAKQHLTQARDILSSLTSMPEASKLQGEARNQV